MSATLHRALLAAVALIVLCSSALAGPVANIGFLVPKSGLACVRFAEHWWGALAAVDYVKNQTWWPADVSLNLTVVSGTSPFDHMQAASKYLADSTAAGSPAIALVGPPTSDSMQYIRFMAGAWNIPVLAFSTTSYALTNLDGAPPNTFFRLCQSDITTAIATYRAMQNLGLRMFNIMYVHDSFGRTFFEILDGFAEQGNVTRVREAAFESGNLASIETALEYIKESESRVTVLICMGDDAQLVMKGAAERGMVGKGWQYIGAGWVQAHVWLDNLDEEEQEFVNVAMQGVLGVIPDNDDTENYRGGALLNFKYIPGVTKAGDPVQCPGLLASDVRKGVSTSPYLPYAFNSVLAAASAYANAYKTCNGCDVNGGLVKAQLAASNVSLSPLTYEMIFLSSGDQFNVTLNLVNIVGESVIKVGNWQASMPNKTNPTVNDYLTTGAWGPLSPIVFPGGGTAVPADRVAEHNHLGVWFYFLVLFGVAVSVLLGSAMHRNHMYTFPESGATLIVGMAIGLFLLAVSNPSLIQHAKFDPELFSLALLPIIIFESGYSLNLEPFFSQLGSILMFALAGTITATLICGIALFEFGKAGWVPQMAFEEYMALASLVSATDPVATLSVFSALNVQPHLYSIVYGEAVLNDAVAIVLYRTFTNFLTVQSTTGLWIVAILTFFGILIGSTIIGGIFGLLSTMSFKYLHMGNKESNGIAETGVLLLFAYGSYAFAEACTLSGIVASLFCGIAMNHYNTKVLSPNGRHLAFHTFKILAYLSETSVFIQVGINVIAFIGDFRLVLVLLMIILCIISRAVQVFSYANILNCFRTKAIPTNHIIQIWHAGLRGAIAYALSTSFPSQNQGIVINATSCIVVFTIFIMGGTTTTSLKLLKIECGAEANAADALKRMNEDVKENKTKQWMLNIDKTYIKPFLYRKSIELDESRPDGEETPAAHA